MNHDFLTSGTPGSARILTRLESVSNINLDPAIRELAKTGLVSDDEIGKYPVNETERAAIQSLIDFDFRAVFPHGGRGPMLTLLAARLANISPIIILTTKYNRWREQCNLFGLKLDEDCFVIQWKSKLIPDADLIRDRRHGLLIIDDMLGSSERLFAMDFPKTVVLTERRLVSDLAEPIGVIAPGAPTDILTNLNAIYRRDLEIMGFKTTRPADLAFLLNVVTDLMLITKEVEDVPPEVDIDPDVFARLERNIALGHIRLE